MFLHQHEMTMQSAKDWVANSETNNIGTISIVACDALGLHRRHRARSDRRQERVWARRPSAVGLSAQAPLINPDNRDV